MITKYENICSLCDKAIWNDKEIHHLCFGSNRKKSDEDGLVMPMHGKCHRNAPGSEVIRRIHDNPAAEKLSKMLGEAYWMAIYNRSDEEVEQLKEIFRKRYGENYL